MMKATNTKDMTNTPKDDLISQSTKEAITHAIKEQLIEKKMSVRNLATSLEMKHPQIIRVTNGANYNIDTLIKILDGLDLEIIIKPKSKNKK